MVGALSKSRAGKAPRIINMRNFSIRRFSLRPPDAPLKLSVSSCRDIAI